MKPSEGDREKIESEMNTLDKAPWRRAVAEIHYFGEQLNIFLLLHDVGKIGAAYLAIKSLLKSYFDRFDETEFNVTFFESRDGDLFIWDSVSDEDLRERKSISEVGLEPSKTPLRASDLFGLNT